MKNVVLITPSETLAKLVTKVMEHLAVRIHTVITVDLALLKMQEIGTPDLILMLPLSYSGSHYRYISRLRDAIEFCPILVCAQQNSDDQFMLDSLCLNRQLPYPISAELLIEATTNALNMPIPESVA